MTKSKYILIIMGLLSTVAFTSDVRAAGDDVNATTNAKQTDGTAVEAAPYHRDYLEGDAQMKNAYIRANKAVRMVREYIDFAGGGNSDVNGVESKIFLAVHSDCKSPSSVMPKDICEDRNNPEAIYYLPYSVVQSLSLSGYTVIDRVRRTYGAFMQILTITDGEMLSEEYFLQLYAHAKDELGLFEIDLQEAEEGIYWNLFIKGMFGTEKKPVNSLKDQLNGYNLAIFSVQGTKAAMYWDTLIERILIAHKSLKNQERN